MGTLKKLVPKMLWVEYSIEQAGNNFTVKGDWPGEVMGMDKDGNSVKEYHLYKPGDKFVVNEHGWLMRCNPEDLSESE